MQPNPPLYPEHQHRRLHHPHDRLFKALLDARERVADLLRKHLPEEITELLDDQPPMLVDGLPG